MRLNQMFTNVLSLSFSDLVTKVIKDSAKRKTALEQSMSKNDFTPKKTSAPRLSDEEKSILKALGLSAKTLKQLKESI